MLLMLQYLIISLNEVLGASSPIQAVPFVSKYNNEEISYYSYIK